MKDYNNYYKEASLEEQKDDFDKKVWRQQNGSITELSKMSISHMKGCFKALSAKAIILPGTLSDQWRIAFGIEIEKQSTAQENK